MDTPAELKKLLREVLGENPNLPLTATIVSVESETCTIKLLSELVLSDVRLRATITQSEDGLTVYPKVGSEVVVMSQTGKLSGLMVIKVDSIDKIKYKSGDFEFLADGTTQKVKIKNSIVSVGALIGSFIDTVKSAQVIVAGTPGTVSPTTQTQLEQIKAQFQTILED